MLAHSTDGCTARDTGLRSTILGCERSAAAAARNPDSIVDLQGESAAKSSRRGIGSSHAWEGTAAAPQPYELVKVAEP